MDEAIIELHLEGKAARAKSTGPSKNEQKKCLYFDEVSCTYPADKYYFCRGCPRSMLSMARSVFETNGKYVNAVAGLAGLVVIIILQMPNLTAFFNRLFPGIIP